VQITDKEKAYEIMELNPGATNDEVSKRYGILTRKFRTIDRDENGYTIEDITQAYNLLMGITYKDDKEELRQKKLRENPPFIARILKKDPVKLENFFHYYKVHIIVAIIAAVLIFSIVRSCVNQVHYDFSLVIFGEAYTEDEQKIETFIKEHMPSSLTPSVQVLPSFESDPQYQYATQMKFVAMVAAKEIDVIITNKSFFESHSLQGTYMPLDDIKDNLGYSDDRYVKNAAIVDETDEGEPVTGPEKIYGVSLADSEFIKENGIYGEDLIAAIVVTSERVDKAIEFMKLLK